MVGVPDAPRWAWVVMVVGAVTLVLLLPVALHRGVIDPGPLPADSGGSAVTPVRPPPVASPSATTAAPTTPGPVPLGPLRADGVLTVLFLGDGITAGFGASARGAAFPALMTARLQANGPVRETITSGEGARVADALAVAGTVAPADLMVVQFGTGDLLQGSAQQFATDYPALLDALRARASGAVLLCAGTWASARAAAPYDAVIRTACEGHDGRYVALSPVYEQSDTHAAGDETHPDDAGHRAVADALLAQVRG